MSEDLNTEAIDRAYRIMTIITDAERRARERKSHAELQAGINAAMSKGHEGLAAFPPRGEEER